MGEYVVPNPENANAQKPYGANPLTEAPKEEKKVSIPTWILVLIILVFLGIGAWLIFL